jgi:class I fructose-bisphosphate aldolase
MASKQIMELLGDKAEYLLGHTCKTIDKSSITLPSPNHVDEIWSMSNRNNRVMLSMQQLLDHGRLGGT